MKLFRVQFDGQSDYVEAETMQKAIERWHEHSRADDPKWDDPFTPEPDGVELVSERSVLR